MDVATRHRRFRFALVVTIAIATLAGCASATPIPPVTTSPAPTASATPTPTPTPTPTVDPLAGLSLRQRVGQLFMVGTTASAAQSLTLNAITKRHVGNVFLSGRSARGVDATAAVTAKLRARVTEASTAGIPLLIATDQEGGKVQVLSGPGFSTIPSGLTQGTLSAATLRDRARSWGRELAAAGITMNLAPVVDLIASPADAANNPPIGAFQRQFGYSASTIITHANAFREGMAAANITTVLKHFPGLGEVTGNTDTTAGVTDTHISPDGTNVGIYRRQIAAGADCIMMSSAIYTQIDPKAPAVFSRTVVTDLLRDELGYTGVIMSDDLSSAAQVRGWTPQQRAVLAIRAGVDIVLVSHSPELAARMVDAVVGNAKADPEFAALVDAAATRVLAFKAAHTER